MLWFISQYVTIEIPLCYDCLLYTSPWATTGKTKDRKPNIITSLELRPEEMEKNNIRFQAKYRVIEENEVRFEEIDCEDAEYLIVAFGSIDVYKRQGQIVIVRSTRRALSDFKQRLKKAPFLCPIINVKDLSLRKI